MTAKEKELYNPSPKIFRKLVASASPFLRSYPIEIRGEENLPVSESSLFASNHSNTHDFFTAIEVFSRINRPLTVLAAWDGLNFISRSAFAMANAVFIKRFDKASCKEGLAKFCSALHHGENGLIFPEATWNLHPLLPMQKMKAGIVRAALQTNKPIIPMIMEYIEVPHLCSKEKQLYTKCIVQFGHPIYPDHEEDVFLQTGRIQSVMEDMRRSLWKEFGIVRTTISDVNPSLYMNHLDMKKNHAFGFIYHSEEESRFLLKKENEFYLDDRNEFVPVSFSDSHIQ